jgi:hypothetical protein
MVTQNTHPARQTRPRPFAAAHWSLPLLLGAALAAYELSVKPCLPSRGPALGLALWAVIICAALWSNHLPRAPLRGFKAMWSLIACSFYDVAGLGLMVSLPIILFTPAYQCYAESVRISLVFESVRPVLDTIETRAAAAGGLAHAGAGLKVGQAAMKGPTVVSGGAVSEDGVVVVVAREPAAAIILTPAFKAGKVEWICAGFPRSIMPASCRDDTRP